MNLVRLPWPASRSGRRPMTAAARALHLRLVQLWKLEQVRNQLWVLGSMRLAWRTERR